MLFLLESKASKFWSVKYKKWERKLAFIFLLKVIYYSILCWKNYNFNKICQRIYELLPHYLARLIKKILLNFSFAFLLFQSGYPIKALEWLSKVTWKNLSVKTLVFSFWRRNFIAVINKLTEILSLSYVWWICTLFDQLLG